MGFINERRASSVQVKGDSAASWQPPGTFAPGQAFAPTSKVELSISCTDLADMDVFSKSDPFLVLYIQCTAGWLELGRTETIDNTLNPCWQTKFVLDFTFEKRQMLRFEVYDEDSSTSMQLADNDFIGQCECSLGEVVACQGRGITRPLVGEKLGQTITVVAEELLSCKEWIHLTLSGKKLDRKDWWGFGSSDPFLTLLKAGEFSNWTVVHRTEVKKGKLSPHWAPLTLSLSSLCNGDHHRPLRLRVEDWNKNGSHSLIGELETTVAELRQLSSGTSLSLFNQKKKTDRGGFRDSGKLILHDMSLETRPTFLDFIQQGTELNFVVAIDFTASNGNPNHYTSLHYKDPTGAPNQYVMAIKSVGDIIQDYDSDKLFPALGFGARVPPDGRVSHDFPLKLADCSPCEGVSGIIAAYNNALTSIQLYGPTNFSPIINHVSRLARANRSDASNYFVLLIITDGVITDLDATKTAVVEASLLPMSIIIIGVGSEDFTAMDELDSDDSLLMDNQGQVAARDIVQFVELQQFMSGQGNSSRWNKDLLSREVLAELPDQIVSYMLAKGFRPGQQASGDRVYQAVQARRCRTGQGIARGDPQAAEVYRAVPSAPPPYSKF